MIKFVNAKINLGLNITEKRADGYHNLETVFFPVGLESGLPHQPEPFDDILEIIADGSGKSGCRFKFLGRRVDCPPEKNLIVKAATCFMGGYNSKYDDIERYGMFEIILDKHLPDGAGMGGGSADAAFCLTLLNEITGEKFSKHELAKMALRLGADCPFFIYNCPCFAEGIGEDLTPITLNMSGLSLLIVKPEINISTKEAFAGIMPRKPEFDLRDISTLPLEEWKNKVTNDFETTLFPKYPVLGKIKNELYSHGADFALMTGSGSAIYGIFRDREKSMATRDKFKSTYSEVWLFGL